MVLRDQKAGSYSDDGLNVVGNTPHISAPRQDQAARASGKVAQDGRVPGFSTTSRQGQTY